MDKLRLKQSRHWWIKKDLKWIIDNASFVYCVSNDYNRPIIVTKLRMGESNCFKIDTDVCGITINSHWGYSALPCDLIRKSNDVKLFLYDFLNNYGASEYINPRFNILNIFRKRKDIIISI